MKKLFFLSTCSTCQRIIKQLALPSDLELIDIKQTNIDLESLEFIRDKAGSYELLFSKKAMKYKAQGLDKKTLSEPDYKEKILEEYTFLKRPIICHNDFLSIGNSSEEVGKAILYFQESSSF